MCIILIIVINFCQSTLWYIPFDQMSQFAKFFNQQNSGQYQYPGFQANLFFETQKPTSRARVPCHGGTFRCEPPLNGSI